MWRRGRVVVSSVVVMMVVVVVAEHQASTTISTSNTPSSTPTTSTPSSTSTTPSSISTTTTNTPSSTTPNTNTPSSIPTTTSTSSSAPVPTTTTTTSTTTTSSTSSSSSFSIPTFNLPNMAPSRILVVDVIGSISHKNFIMSVAQHLAQRNHSVTYLTTLDSKKKKKNNNNNNEVKEVYVPFDLTIPNLFNTSVGEKISLTMDYIHKTCFTGLESHQFQSLKKEKFDLYILSSVFTDCYLPHIYTQGVPHIYVSPNVIQGTTSELASTPFFTSLSGSILLDLDGFPLSFTDRLKSVLHDQVALFIYRFALSRLEAECKAKKLCPEDVPSLAEMRTHGSLFIVNSVLTLESPALPYTPTVVHAGGIHCRPSQPLPKSLEEWVAGSGQAGFIYFSLGSLVKPADMPEKYRSVLVEVFGSLQQRVLWKWHQDTMEALPPNVRLSKWLPQQDILGHPQLRLFITHGGLLSLQEATYHGVPVLGFPVNIDQKHNLNQAQREGWGRLITWENLTFDHLHSTILEMIDDTSIQDVTKRRLSVMRDQPVPPGDWATYWVEYVIRHQGADHLRCPATRMPWYELYNVDVWVFVLMVTVTFLVLVCFISYKCFRCLLTCCRRSTKTKKE
ncbi:hypothetical protein Pcinc_022865 [Petrolisthes cinctipes]|uniref:Uncharacterized protein n=1 Tax=Petrolisthes cinctipes TaxID=88211 RepID=A0AAE1KG41_PETCI|nr:hypothetical protein Pcinc_022865 [Petrolisthes cinctipes]